MTTTVIVHNSHRKVTVVMEDRLWDADKQALSDAWKETGRVDVHPGSLFNGYCTDTRRLTIVEPPLEPVTAGCGNTTATS